MNHWNELVAIINNETAKTENYTSFKDKSFTWAETAKVHLDGLNTASGAQLKPLIEIFVKDFKSLKK